MILLSGNSNRPLSLKISQELQVPLCHNGYKQFKDREIFVEILENIYGQDVFFIQPTSRPANDSLMELLMTLDALKRASARTITAVIPYFGYARQDRKTGPNAPISAQLVANLLQSAGANRILALELHSQQTQDFFDIPIDNLLASELFAETITLQKHLDNLVVVSPDTGGIARAQDVAKRLELEIVTLDKRRPSPGTSEVVNVRGQVKDKTCLIIDDIVDSGGTLINAAHILKEQGAKGIYAYCVHGVLSQGAHKKITTSSIDKLFITDSIAHSPQILDCAKIELLSIAPLLASSIKRIYEDYSLKRPCSLISLK